MNNETFKRTAGYSAFIAALLILASAVVLFTAVDFNSELLENPTDLITDGFDEGAAELFRWGSILEMFGYFVFFIPVAVYLWYWLAPRSPRWVTLFTVLGLISIVIGIFGAALRATFFPVMMVAYPQVAEAQSQTLQVIFLSLSDFTFEGLYALDSLLAGLWLLGIGLVLRAERRTLGIATLVLGVAILGAGLGWLLQIDPLARLELAYFLQPLWAIWLGIVIYRRDEQIEPAMKPGGRAELYGAQGSD